VIYPVQGKKSLVVWSAIACAVILSIATVLIVLTPPRAWLPILGIALAVSSPFVFGTRRDLKHWQYEIRGTDLLFDVSRLRDQVPISRIEKVLPTEGSTRLWWGDMLQVTYVPGTPMMPTLLNPVDKGAFLRGLAEADPGLVYDGTKVSRTG